MHHPQCGAGCKQKAQMACLLCRSQPKIGKYHFCGKFCRNIAWNSAPLILEAKPGHTTFKMGTPIRSSDISKRTHLCSCDKVYGSLEDFPAMSTNQTSLQDCGKLEGSGSLWCIPVCIYQSFLTISALILDGIDADTAVNVSAIMGPRASAKLGMAAKPIYVSLPHVQSVRSSGHRSKWALPTLGERKSSIWHCME
jgi:hypothetical protein